MTGIPVRSGPARQGLLFREIAEEDQRRACGSRRALGAADGEARTGGRAEATGLLFATTVGFGFGGGGGRRRS